MGLLRLVVAPLPTLTEVDMVLAAVAAARVGLVVHTAAADMEVEAWDTEADRETESTRHMEVAAAAPVGGGICEMIAEIETMQIAEIESMWKS